MKIAGKRIPKGNLLLFVSFAAISLCFLLIFSVTRADRENNMSKNNMYSGHQKGFSILQAEEDQWADVIPGLAAEYDRFALYVSVPDPEIVVRGVFTDGDVSVPPMLEGTYFTADTSWMDQPGIVLGKQYKNDVTKRDGKMYYRYLDTEYEVLGIMGTEGESRLNHMMMMDFQSAVRLAGINSDYVLDTKKKSAIAEIGKSIEERFAYPANVLIVLEEGGAPSPIAQFLSSEAIMNTMYVMMLVSFSLSTVLVTLIWFRFRRQLFFVWSLCGYEQYAERLDISKRFYLTAGSGFAAGVCLMLAASARMPDIRIAGGDVVRALVMTFGWGTLILFFCYFLDKRKSRRR